MGKATGFLEYERVDGRVTPPAERILNFEEFHETPDAEEQKKQGGRCMECGVPFCQAGMMIAGMASGCPLHNLVPEVNDLVYHGNYKEAYLRLSTTHSFPEFTSRVCPALCENACTCGLHTAPVATKENEKTIIEYAYENGLVEVENPSELLLSGRPLGAPGTCVACAIEGTRPVLAEIQALVVTSSFNVPRRTTDGFDFNRATLLMAVLDKRGGMRLSGCDGYINVIGGLTLSEPAADLPLVLAIASSYRDKALPSGMAAIGEVGLTGEIRAVNYLPQRLQELHRLGFDQVLIPHQGSARIIPPEGIQVIRVKNIRQAIEEVLG